MAATGLDNRNTNKEVHTDAIHVDVEVMVDYPSQSATPQQSETELIDLAHYSLPPAGGSSGSDAPVYNFTRLTAEESMNLQNGTDGQVVKGENLGELGEDVNPSDLIIAIDNQDATPLPTSASSRSSSSGGVGAGFRDSLAELKVAPELDQLKKALRQRVDAISYTTNDAVEYLKRANAVLDAIDSPIRREVVGMHLTSAGRHRSYSQGFRGIGEQRHAMEQETLSIDKHKELAQRLVKSGLLDENTAHSITKYTEDMLRHVEQTRSRLESNTTHELNKYNVLKMSNNVLLALAATAERQVSATDAAGLSTDERTKVSSVQNRYGETLDFSETREQLVRSMQEHPNFSPSTDVAANFLKECEQIETNRYQRGALHGTQALLREKAQTLARENSIAEQS